MKTKRSGPLMPEQEEIAKSVQSFLRLWETCSASIYGDNPPPYDAKWWFYCGAVSVFQTLGDMAEAAMVEAAAQFTDDSQNDRFVSERLRCLMDEVYNGFRQIGLQSDRPTEPRRDWGPN